MRIPPIDWSHTTAQLHQPRAQKTPDAANATFRGLHSEIADQSASTACTGTFGVVGADCTVRWPVAKSIVARAAAL